MILMNIKRIHLFVLIVLISVSILLMSCGNKPQYQKWEYKTVNIEFKNPRDLEPFLNEYGKGGWELIYMNNNLYVFKRTQL